MRLASRLGLTLPLLGVLACAGWVAIETSRAESALREASVEMGSWVSRGANLQAGTWASVRDRLDKSRRLLPTDPTTHELRGLLASMRSDDAGELSVGVEEMVAAVGMRPVSPYSWAHLAEAQYRRGEPGRNLQYALNRAAELGAAEPGVQRLVADYGLAIWDEIDPETQAAIDRLLAAGFRRNPLEMLLISERRGRLDVACRHLAGTTRTPDSRLVTRCTVRESTQ